MMPTKPTLWLPFFRDSIFRFFRFSIATGLRSAHYHEHGALEERDEGCDTEI
jgi:hypothetical protein